MCLHITMALPLSVSLVMAESNDLPASSSSGSMDKVKICKLKHIYLILLHIHNRKHQIDFDQTEKIAATAFFVCEYHRFHNGLVVHFLVCQKYFLSDPNVSKSTSPKELMPRQTSLLSGLGKPLGCPHLPHRARRGVHGSRPHSGAEWSRADWRNLGGFLSYFLEASLTI